MNKKIVGDFIILTLIVVSLIAFNANAKETCNRDSAKDCSNVSEVLEGLGAVNLSGENNPPVNTTCVPYFYGRECPKCAETEPFIEEIERKYVDRIHIRRLEVYHNKTNYDLLMSYCVDTGIPTDSIGIPFIVIGDKYLMGKAQIKENLETEILSLTEIPGSCPLQGMECHGVDYEITEISPSRKIDVSTPLIITSGLIDGINPCAFAVLIFLLAYLNIEKNRRKMIAVGFTYISMIYVTYFLAGLGLLGFIQISGLTSTLYKIAAVTAIIAGLINVKDYFWYGKGISLRIPESGGNTIKKWARKVTIPSAIVLGFLVAMFELPCTGGVYLAILSMMADNTTITNAIPYLLLYNLMFILPLIGIFLAVYSGINTIQVEKWRQGKQTWMRLAIGLLLIGLGVIMLYNMLVL